MAYDESSVGGIGEQVMTAMGQITEAQQIIRDMHERAAEASGRLAVTLTGTESPHAIDGQAAVQTAREELESAVQALDSAHEMAARYLGNLGIAPPQE